MAIFRRTLILWRDGEVKKTDDGRLIFDRYVIIPIEEYGSPENDEFVHLKMDVVSKLVAEGPTDRELKGKLVSYNPTRIDPKLDKAGAAERLARAAAKRVRRAMRNLRLAR